MSFRVRFTRQAEEDLLRLYDFLLVQDFEAAERALQSIRDGIDMLKRFPFSCRKAAPDQPRLRELIIPFGGSGPRRRFCRSETAMMPPTLISASSGWGDTTRISSGCMKSPRRSSAGHYTLSRTGFWCSRWFSSANLTRICVRISDDSLSTAVHDSVGPDHLVLRLSDPWGETRLADEMLSQAPARCLEDRSSII